MSESQRGPLLCFAEEIQVESLYQCFELHCDFSLSLETQSTFFEYTVIYSN